MSYYTEDTRLALIEYSKIPSISDWFYVLKRDYNVDVKDALIERALTFTESKEPFFDPTHKNDMATKDPMRYFSIIFKNTILSDVTILRSYLQDPTKMRSNYDIVFCEKILKQSNRQNKLEQLV